MKNIKMKKIRSREISNIKDGTFKVTVRLNYNPSQRWQAIFNNEFRNNQRGGNGLITSTRITLTDIKTMVVSGMQAKDFQICVNSVIKPIVDFANKKIDTLSERENELIDNSKKIFANISF